MHTYIFRIYENLILSPLEQKMTTFIDLNLNEVKEEEETTINAWEYLHIRNTTERN
jgi:hypothetical protein